MNLAPGEHFKLAGWLFSTFTSHVEILTPLSAPLICLPKFSLCAAGTWLLKVSDAVNFHHHFFCP
jgi:hypothetical protein